ncbi:MAG: ribosome recycling factor [Candidatus Taylorbacteria bacterium]|nr:ribosome recycling factor [Candidatus Taylorbacteria bacterium]
MAYDFTKFKKSLSGTEEWVKKEFTGIRTGQANPMLLDNVKVESYGVLSPLGQVGAVTLEGSRSLRIVPWDASQSKEIEKALTLANLGVSVSVDEKGLRVNFPELTSESRASIVKLAKERLEEGRKQIRLHRDDAMKDLKAKVKAVGIGEDEMFRHEKEIQKFVDDTNKKLDLLFVKKEKEITA